MPASARRYALTDPPKPEPTTTASKWESAVGEALIAPSVTRRLLERFAKLAVPADETHADRLRELTEREIEVLTCLGRGMSNAQIAAEAYMSVATVKAHVSRLLTKLEAANRVQVALVVHDAGLA